MLSFFELTWPHTWDAKLLTKRTRESKLVHHFNRASNEYEQRNTKPHYAHFHSDISFYACVPNKFYISHAQYIQYNTCKLRFCLRPITCQLQFNICAHLNEYINFTVEMKIYTISLIVLSSLVLGMVSLGLFSLKLSSPNFRIII